MAQLPAQLTDQSILPQKTLNANGPSAVRDRMRARIRWLLVAVLGLLLVMRFFDTSFVRLTHDPEYRRSGLHTALWSLGRLETWLAFCVIAIICVGRVESSLGRAAAYRLRAMALGAFLSATTAGIIAELLKRLVGRMRPVVNDTTLEVTTRYKGFLGGFFDDSNLGFPSSHTAVIAGAALLLAAQHPHPRAAIWSIVVIALVSYQRLAQSAHFPTDVLAGVLIGAACAWYVSSRIDAIAPPDEIG